MEERKMIKVNLPFIRVYPISSMHYNKNLRLITLTRTDSSIEIWAYPSWNLLTRLNLDLNLVLKKVYLIEQGGKKILVILTANAYILLYNLNSGEIYQTVNHGGSFAWDCDFFQFDFLEGEKDMVEEDLEGYLVLACQDGASRLYNMNSEGKIALRRSSAGDNGSCMSVAFSKDGAYYFSGNSDGLVRKISTKTGKNMLTINTGLDEKKEKIWALEYVEPYYIVVGYSSGKVKFMETTFGTMIKEFNEHSGDILSILVSNDSERIFVTGADSKIVCFNKIIEDIEGLERVDFEYGSSDRGQSHDIYSMLELHDDLIISAGLSTDICMYKIVGNKFRERRQGTNQKIKLRHITYCFKNWQVDCSKKSGLLVTSNGKFLDIFKIDEDENDINYLCKIERENLPIETFALNQKTPMVAYCTQENIEIMWFNFETGDIKRLSTEFGMFGGLAMKFQKSRLFVILSDRSLLVYNYSQKEAQYHKLKSLKEIGKFDIFDVSIDLKHILIGDTVNQILKIVNIETKKSFNISELQKAKFVNSCFSKKSTNVYTSYTTNRFIVTNKIGQVKYTSFSKIPSEIHKIYDKFENFSFSESKQKIILSSKYSFYPFTLNRERFSSIKRLEENDLYNKETVNDPVEEKNLKIYKTSKPIALIKEYGDDFMMVQFSWDSAMKDIPDPVISKNFGQ